MDFGDMKDKAEDFVKDHDEQVEGGIDKAADMAKEKVGHDDQVDAAAEKAKGFISGDQ